MKKVLAGVFIAAVVAAAGCGSGSNAGAPAQDTGAAADVGQITDRGVAPADTSVGDTGADCPLGCNVGERCENGLCVPDDAGFDGGVADGGGDAQPWDGGAWQIMAGTDPKQFALRGLVITGDQVLDPGEVYFSDGKLVCVRADCSQFYDYGVNAGKATFIDTQGIITAGLIDPHNHMAYNVVPFHDFGRFFQNRYQWQALSEHYDVAEKGFNDLTNAGLICEMVKFAETIEMLSGVTSVQGTSHTGACDSGFVRNMDNDYNDFGLHRVVDRVPKIDKLSATDAGKIVGDLASGTIKAFVVHIGEGVDDASRAELDTLQTKGLLLDKTSIIHGTGFQDAQWDKVKAAGARMIWSPKSNMSLYNATTDVVSAVKKEIAVSLGPDWSESGSKNLLDEVRYAVQFNKDRLGSFFTAQDFVKMVTENAAASIAFDDLIGKLSEGYTADVSVFARRGTDAYAAFSDLSAEDVELVFVNGAPLHGRSDWMDKIPKPDFCEPVDVCGISKSVCLKTADTTNKHNQSLQDVIGALKAVYPGLVGLVNCR